MNGKTTTDAWAAQVAQRFIGRQAHGAGSWPDGTDVVLPRVRGGWLKVTDTAGTDERGMERHIEVRVDGRVIATLVYLHQTQELDRIL